MIRGDRGDALRFAEAAVAGRRLGAATQKGQGAVKPLPGLAEILVGDVMPALVQGERELLAGGHSQEVDRIRRVPIAGRAVAAVVSPVMVINDIDSHAGPGSWPGVVEDDQAGRCVFVRRPAEDAAEARDRRSLIHLGRQPNCLGVGPCHAL